MDRSASCWKVEGVAGPWINGSKYNDALVIMLVDGWIDLRDTVHPSMCACSHILPAPPESGRAPCS